MAVDLQGNARPTNFLSFVKRFRRYFISSNLNPTNNAGRLYYNAFNEPNNAQIGRANFRFNTLYTRFIDVSGFNISLDISSLDRDAIESRTYSDTTAASDTSVTLGSEVFEGNSVANSGILFTKNFDGDSNVNRSITGVLSKGNKTPSFFHDGETDDIVIVEIPSTSPAVTYNTGTLATRPAALVRTFF